MTIIIIIFAIIILIAASKKDKHNVMEDAEAISKLPSFTIHAQPMSTISKIINAAITKRNLLKSFFYSDNKVTIVMHDDSSISALLRDIFVDFEKVHGLTSYKVKYKNQKLKFYYTTNISKKEWDAINGVLCLAGSTRGRSIFSKQAKQIGYINIALKAIKALS